MLPDPSPSLLALWKVDRLAYRQIINGQIPVIDDEPAKSGDAEIDTQNEGGAVTSCGLGERACAGNAFLAKLGLGEAQEGPVAGAPPRMAVHLLPSPTASTTTIVFSGNNKLFALPVDLFVNYDTNLVLIRDPKRCFCLAGIPGLGDDYATCLSNLRRVLKALGAKPLFIVGVSAGGSAALKFGCDLKAESILGFSVPTTLDLDDDPGAELKHYPQLTMLYKHDRSLGIDLAAFYRAQMPRPSVTLLYSAGHGRDSWLAERMSGIEGAELVEAVGYAGHSVFQWMTDEMKLGPLFDKLYASKPLLKSAQQGGGGAHGDRPQVLEPKAENFSRRAKTSLDYLGAPVHAVDQ